MKGRESVAFGDVCVPKADDQAEGQFSHQKAVYPSKCKLYKEHVLSLKMIEQWRIEFADELAQAV